MNQNFKEGLSRVRDFLSGIATTAIAMAIIVVLLLVLRLVWPGPLDFTSVVEQVLNGPSRPIRNAANVEYRLSSGEPGNLGPLLIPKLRGDHGPPIAMVDGVFRVPDARPGMPCVVMIGSVSERVRIQIDPDLGTLFVRSQFTRTQLLSMLNGGLYR